MMESDNEEDGVVSYRNKYRQLKSRLKYLIYEHECFENDIQKAQMKLLQLSRDKSFLLDQLMRYEAVVLSGGEEETDYSSGEETLPTSTTAPQQPPLDTQKADSGTKSDVVEPPAKPTAPSSSARSSQLTKQGIAKATALLHTVATNTGTKTSTVKPAVVKKTTKASTKVSAVAAAKITKAVARARQAQPPVPITSSPLIVSLPLNVTGRSKQSQATPTKLPQMTSIASTSSTAAILASIPAPPKPPSKVLSSVPPSRPTGKGLPATLGEEGQPSSSSTSSSSSDSEDSGSDSSSSSSSREEPMETGGPVPIVHSVPVPAGGPQLVRPKAIVSPVKAPPQLIPVDPSSSTAASHPPLLSPLTTSPCTQSQATRFLWSNRTSTDGQATPTTGFTSIAPPLSSPTSATKPFSGSAFQLVTSPPGSATLHRPPSLQDLSGTETGRPHPPP